MYENPKGLHTTFLQKQHKNQSTLKPWYNETRFSEFCDKVN